MNVRYRRAALLALTVVAGCNSRVVRIGAVAPKPRIDLPRQSTSLALELGGTPNRFRIAADILTAVQVHDFHRTLRNGFRTGFASAFALDGYGRPELTLVVDVIAIEIVRTRSDGHTATGKATAKVTLAHGTHSASPVKAPRRRGYVRISYRASVRRGAQEVARLSGYGHSRRPADGSQASLSEAIASAVASVYERIGRDLFVRRMAWQ